MQILVKRHTGKTNADFIFDRKTQSAISIFDRKMQSAIFIFGRKVLGRAIFICDSKMLGYVIVIFRRAYCHWRGQ